MIKYLKPYKKQLIIVLIALIISALSVLSIGIGVQNVIDKAFVQKNHQALDHSIFILLILVTILAIATFARYYFITKVGESVISDIRRDIFSNLITLSPSFFEKQKVGEIISRITADTTILQTVVGSSLSIVLRNILLFAGSIIMLFIISPRLAFAMIILIPLIVLPVLVFGKKVRNFSKITQGKLANLSGKIEEVLSAIKTVQAFCKEDFELATFEKKNKDVLNTAKKRIFMRAILTMFVILLAFGSIAFLLWYGGKNVLSGNISGGELSAFMFYAVVMATSFGAISEVIGDIQKARGATSELLSLINVKSELIEENKPSKIKDFKKLELKNVSFTYSTRSEKNDLPTLNDINFTIKKGEFIAIVGPSGAGKSTIFELLLRFYDIKDGEILINDTSSKNLSLQNLRGLFSYVTQDNVIFSTNASNNINYGNKHYGTENEKIIQDAAKLAHADEFINKLPDGYDTFLGEKGVRLSGGEKQRIAIARAIIADPEILLFDEATSALDAANEKLVQEALEKITKNRTTIVIAHRLSTVVKADKIIVLDAGRIKATGTHQELLKNNKLYRELAELQFLG